MCYNQEIPKGVVRMARLPHNPAPTPAAPMLRRKPIRAPAGVAPRQPDAIPYEQQLNHNLRWALTEGSQYFEGKGAVQEALHKIARRLHELNIPYAVVGGLALFAHGYRRFTEDVDILVTPEGLKSIHRQLEGLGYIPPFKFSKHLRDTELGVKIEFLTTGGFPGDGKPKPVAFPDPEQVGIEIDGIRYLNLPKLVELKLASGMTSPARLRDLADVLELIRLLDLPADYAAQLDPSVADKFRELWQAVHATPT